MPLLKSQDKTPVVDFKCKIRTDELADLQLYCKAVDSDLDYVATEAFRKLITDKDFLSWKAAHPELLKSLIEKSTGDSKRKVSPRPMKGEAA